LYARKNRFDFTEVDVADHPPGFGAVDEQLDELIVLDDRDPRLARVRIDENFSLHVDRPTDSTEATPRRLRDHGKV
jgi:hypothetical protein